MFLLLSVPARASDALPVAGYRKALLGRWLGRTKFEIFYPDGTWAVQRHENVRPTVDGRRWRLRGRKLTLTFPGGRTTLTIVFMDRAKFVTRDDGMEFIHERAAP